MYTSSRERDKPISRLQPYFQHCQQTRIRIWFVQIRLTYLLILYLNWVFMLWWSHYIVAGHEEIGSDWNRSVKLWTAEPVATREDEIKKQKEQKETIKEGGFPHNQFECKVRIAFSLNRKERIWLGLVLLGVCCTKLFQRPLVAALRVLFFYFFFFLPSYTAVFH